LPFAKSEGSQELEERQRLEKKIFRKIQIFLLTEFLNRVSWESVGGLEADFFIAEKKDHVL